MKGDYYRYISEFSNEEGKKASAEQAEESYKRATDTAEAELPSTHPIRLGLALNYSVFYYEILNQPQKACEMAKLAFDDAITEFDSVGLAVFRIHVFPNLAREPALGSFAAFDLSRPCVWSGLGFHRFPRSLTMIPL